MTIKKVMAFATAAVLTVSLAACGGANTEPTEAEIPTESVEETVIIENEDTTEATEALEAEIETAEEEATAAADAE